MPKPSCQRSGGSGLSTPSSLIDRLRASDAAGWERVVELYGPLLRYWAKQNGASPTDSEEVCQEVFSRVVELIASFQLGDRRGSFRAWLRQITRNVCRERRRSNGPVNQPTGGTDATIQLNEVADPIAEDDDPPELIADLYRRVIALVRGEFSDRDWAVFERLVFDEQSTADIASEMGLAVDNIRKIKSRIYRRLREELGDVSRDATPPVSS